VPPINTAKVHQVECSLFRSPANRNEQSAAEYLADVEERFFFDAAHGIYKPKTCHKKLNPRRLKKLWKNFRNHWALILINIATLLGVIYYARYARLQWCEMQEANRISHDSLEAQTRPWVLIEGEPSTIAATEDEITFKINLRNFGPSPAIVSSSQEFGLRIDLKGMLADFDKICKAADDSIGDMENPARFVSVVPPRTEGISQSASAVTDRSHRTRLGDNPYWMYGCIAYRAPNEHIYHTRVVYQVQAHDSGPPEPRTFTAKITGRASYNFK
jgi:hypothetical protein